MITKAIMAAQGSLQDARELGIFEHSFKDYVPVAAVLNRDSSSNTQRIIFVVDDGVPEDLTRNVPGGVVRSFASQNEGAVKRRRKRIMLHGNKKTRRIFIAHITVTSPLNTATLHAN